MYWFELRILRGNLHVLRTTFYIVVRVCAGQRGYIGKYLNRNLLAIYLELMVPMKNIVCQLML